MASASPTRTRVFDQLKILLQGRRPVSRQDAPMPSYPRVNVFEWRPANGAINFGDHLARIVVARVLAGAAMSDEEEAPRTARLFSVGSVLHFAHTGDVIWGAGVNGKVAVDLHTFSGLDVRAVRGPKTADFLRQRGITVPAVYGDPALLLPHLFGQRFTRAPTRAVAVVPNLHDLADVGARLPVVSPLLGWNRVVEEILATEFVVASSLHGLIIAEAFGIPARYVRLSETENIFKYDDYAMGTGRPEIAPARSIDEAIEMGGLSPIVFDPLELLAAFPWDLWAARPGTMCSGPGRR